MTTRRDLLIRASVLAGAVVAPYPAWMATAATDAVNPKLRAFFAEVFERDLKRSPLTAMQLGRRQDYDKLDEFGEANDIEDDAIAAADLARIAKDFPGDKLSPEDRTYVALFTDRAQQTRESFLWRTHDMVMTMVSGPHVSLPIALINQHKIDSEADAQAYIKRLTQFSRYFAQVRATLERNEAAGVLPPRHFFPAMMTATRNQITGVPFDAGPANAPLWTDITAKIDKLTLDSVAKDGLKQAAKEALLKEVGPAYRALLEWLTGAEARASADHGVWRLPKGDAYYAFCLRRSTSLPMTAAEIHAIGLSEVARVHDEIRQIMVKVGFQGDLAAFLAFTREDAQFYYADTPAGRAAYLSDAQRFTDAIRVKIPDWFGLTPKAPLEIRAVEAFRERSTSSAFYNSPSADGSRPGIFYVNLSNMRARPKYGLETLTYHEGIPGHHMQIAIGQEQPGVPDFQRFGSGYGAFAEGWALYTEALAKEMGMFQDPFSDFGRLVAELWRSVRLVVDTGMHALKWDREKAIQYFLDNTPMERDGAAREIDRYIGWPAQAVSYKIGMLHIQKLRADAERALGARFDIRQFHDVVLRQGRTPLGLLTEAVTGWVKSKS